MILWLMIYKFMSKITFLADVFAEQHCGGGELSNQELISLLKTRGHEVLATHTSQIKVEFLENVKKDVRFIIGNFLGLTEDVKAYLQENFSYVIYEHDHKYLTTRDPSVFQDYLAPESEIINKDFYASAKAVFCQTDLHKEVATKNLKLDNIYSVGGNLWDDNTLDLLESLSKKRKKDKYSIWDSTNPIKNTPLTVAYCVRNNLPYELVGNLPYQQFLEKITDNDKFIFLPQTLETLCRVAVECRMSGMTVITNNKIGAAKEDWFKLKGKDLIDYMSNRKHEVCDLVENKLNE